MSEQAGSATPESRWIDAPLMGFDTETTGVSPRTDRIVTAATVKRRPGGGADSHKAWLIDPGIPIPEGASRIHGVTTEHASAHGRPPSEVVEEINATLADHIRGGGAVVVFNAGFDLPLLEAESVRHGVVALKERLGSIPALVLDPLVLDRALNKYRRGKRTLTALIAAYGLQEGDAHDAVGDSQMTLDILESLMRENPQIARMNPADLMEFQRQQHAVWAEDFENYLARRGRKTRISRHWF